MAITLDDKIALPTPKFDGVLSIEAALAQRRSVRHFAPGAVTLAEVSQLLWSAQGITGADGHRAAPSAGARYPLEIYLVAGNVATLDAGIFKYLPGDHALAKHRKGYWRSKLTVAAWGQSWISDAACIVVLAADIDRTAAKYGARAERYVHMEVGHAVENAYLQAVALCLGTTVVGAFRDAEVAQVVGLAAGERPFALLPIGRLAH